MAISQINSNSLASGVPASSNMPSGSVLQVVSVSSNTNVNISTSTLTTTGITASITPKFSTSKILVTVVNPMRRGAGGGSSYNGIGVALYRNSTNIYYAMSNMGYTYPATNLCQSWLVPMVYLDSPATTSSVTYTQYFRSVDNVIQVSSCVDGDTATITLMEIAG